MLVGSNYEIIEEGLRTRDLQQKTIQVIKIFTVKIIFNLFNTLFAQPNATRYNNFDAWNTRIFEKKV
ncbi:MAG: hypothetical protein Fur0024_4680 [Patescibacteria group bacterium]